MLKKFEAFQIAKLFYQTSKRLKLPTSTRDQFFAANSSIALNLAEGSAKRTAKDQRKFYDIAFGSLRECQAVLEIECVEDEEILALSDRLGAILFKLTQKP